MADDNTRPRDYKGFADYLRALGAQVVRKGGGHEQWRLPNGHNFTLPVQRRDWAAREFVLCRWRDLRRVAAKGVGQP